MIENISLPPEMIDMIGSETKDFAVKASHANPPRTTISLIIFGLVWLLFTGFLGYLFVGPLFQGKEVTILVNDVPKTAGPGNLKEIMVPGIIIGIFILIGLLMFGAGIRQLFKKGGYFVGTPTRLISYHRGKYRSIDWEQFSGDIEVSGNETKGNISLGMRTGRMVSSKNGPDRYVPDTFYISGIQDVYEVERICRKRIKENDPTPPVNINTI